MRAIAPAVVAALVSGIWIRMPDARGEVVLSAGETERDLGGAVEMLEDPGGLLTIEDVTGGAAARFGPEAGMAAGFTKSTVWARVALSLPAGAGETGGWVLHLATSQIDEVDAFLRADAGPWRLVRTGDLRPAGGRDVHHPHFVFRVPSGRVEALFRLRSGGTIWAPLSVVRHDLFVRRAPDAQLAWGFYYAFLAAMAIYNLFLYASVRDRSYLYYVTYLTTFVLFQASFTGHASVHLWPGWPRWANVAPATFLALSLTGSLLFVRRMTNLRETVPRLGRPMAVLAALFTALAPLQLVHFGAAVRAIAALGGLTVLLFPVPIALAYRRGSRQARYVLLAYAAILPGGVLFALRYFRVLPPGFVTDHAVQIGTAVEAMLLSFALADRINLLTRERTAAQARLLEAQGAERKRIAADLHDGLGQGLLVLVQRLVRAAKAPGAAPELASLADEAKGLVADVRRISHDLHPDQLHRLGLGAALREVAEHVLAPVGVALTCRVEAVEGIVPRDAELHLYRIAQEALANVVRHAGARNVELVLERRGRRLSLSIEDDGRGVPAGAPRGLGIEGMRERARLAGGEMTLRAPEGRAGARVEVELPCRDPEARR